MEVMRALRIQALKGRIERSEYRIDVEKVADAILGRPTAHLWLVPASPRVVEPGVVDPDDEGFIFGTPAA
jgi:hypothetical protein